MGDAQRLLDFEEADERQAETSVEVPEATSVEVEFARYKTQLETKFTSEALRAGNGIQIRDEVAKYLGNTLAHRLYNGSLRPIVHASGDPQLDMGAFLYECKRAFDKMLAEAELNYAEEIVAATTSQERDAIFKRIRISIGMQEEK